MLISFRNYLSFFKKYLAFRVYIVLIFAFLAAISESIGILLFIPVIGQFDGSALYTSSQNMLIEIFVQFFDFLNLQFTLKNALIFIGFAFLLKGIFVFSSYSYSSRLRGDLLYKVKYDLLINVQHLQYSAFKMRDVGGLAALVNEHVTKVILTFNYYLHFNTLVLSSVLYISVGMFTSPLLGTLGSIMSVFVFLLFRRLSVKLKTLSYRNSALTNQVTQFTIEGLQNYKYLKSTFLFERYNLQIIKFMSQLRRLNVYNGVAEGFVISVREPILAATLCIILYIQVAMFEFSVTNSLVAMLLFYRGMNSVFNSQRTWQNLLEHSGSIDLLNQELTAFGKNSEDCGSGLEIPDNWSDIVFQEVNFKFSNEEKLVLKNLSLTIPRNKLTVILGPSGSGKTTLVDLLTGLLRPISGRILIGGLELNSVNLRSLRRKIGYVSQEVVAFSDTVANNISSWNVDDDEADYQMQRMRIASERAEILDTITDLEDNFETELGDRGTSFSGGQRQRVFLARELYRKPEILILDESTSALDSQTEKLVFDSITELKGEMTIICITHRQSLALRADNLINLERV